jgi:rhodanese-related sulfurtransferase/DNA-binding transcriptional ArsR family regulator
MEASVKRQRKSRIYEELSRVGKALASPWRLELIELLSQGDRTVEALARATGLPVANVSQHLKVLRESHLVKSQRQGLHVLYRLSDSSVIELFMALRKVAEHQSAELERVVETYLGQRDAFAPVGRNELLERVRLGEVVVVDVRPREEYDAGHIAGAVSVPLDDLEQAIPSLPADVEIVAYCRGPYCVMAHEAVAILRAHARSARRLEDGFPEWKLANLPVEQLRAEPP